MYVGGKQTHVYSHTLMIIFILNCTFITSFSLKCIPLFQCISLLMYTQNVSMEELYTHGIEQKTKKAKKKY